MDNQHEHPHYDLEALFNPETHHEESDVNVTALLWSVAVFVVVSAIAHFLVLAMFHYFKNAEENHTPPLTSVNLPVDAGVPPLPRLQPLLVKNGPEVLPNHSTPVTDMDDMHAAEDAAQQNYGWVDAQKGVVRIPIDRAKELMLQQGFPVTGVAPATAPATVVAPATATSAPSTPPVKPVTEGARP